MKNNVKVQDDTQSLQSCVSVSVTDLRIGNYVIYNNNEIGTISGVQDFLINYGKVAINQRIDIFYHIENIKPIKITEKWLLKFGFENIKNEDYYLYPFTFRNNKIRIGHASSTRHLANDIIYLHQLQNLYHALTGSELLIGSITEH